jgi:predicted N-acetyltransferase YhbS
MFRDFQLQSTWANHDPRQPHWHLGPIGVLPQLQWQGIGSRLLLKCCEIIDQRKEAAYLETDRPENVPLYGRFGFVVTDEEQILGVTNWFMWRSPR